MANTMELVDLVERESLRDRLKIPLMLAPAVSIVVLLFATLGCRAAKYPFHHVG